MIDAGCDSLLKSADVRYVHRIYFFVSVGRLQPISRDTDNNGEMYKCWWTNKGANEKAIVLVHQHGRNDVRRKPPI